MRGDVAEVGVSGGRREILAGKPREESIPGIQFAKGAEFGGLLPILRTHGKGVAEKHDDRAFALQAASVAAIATESQDSELIRARCTNRRVEEPHARQRPCEVYLRRRKIKIDVGAVTS